MMSDTVQEGHKPMIENSERGITLNKTLAWSMLLAVVSGGIWIGTVVTDAKNGVENLGTRQNEDRASIAANTRAIGDLRSSNARIDQRLLSIEGSATRTENKLDRLLEIIQGGPRQ